MNSETNAPGKFDVYVLYQLLRNYCQTLAPYPLEKLTVPAVVNSFMKKQSGMKFHMSDTVPPEFSGELSETFAHYIDEEEKWPLKGSAAWFTIQFMRLKTGEDIDRLGHSLDAMAKWMTSTGYLIESTSEPVSYLPTAKMLENPKLIF